MNRLFADGAVTGFSDSELLERFVAAHDTSAFEALVARHGPTVLSACHGFLKDSNDAEDAFQATFLILVKKSETFHGHIALGPWLYKVARRVSMRANAGAARRRAHERKAGEMAATTSGPTATVPDDHLQTLHEEIARLPDRYRRALILCDLQRVPQVQAAAQLRMSERTLQRRLTEARNRLKSRLARCGLDQTDQTFLSVILLAHARAAVPPAWSEATVRTALGALNHSTAIGTGSVAAAALTQEVLKIMWFQKLALATAMAIAGGLVAWGASDVTLSGKPDPEKPITGKATSSSQTKAKPSTAKAQANVRQPSTKIPIRGRVISPNGQPIAGAKLYFTPAAGYLKQPHPSTEQAITSSDGFFQFSAQKEELDAQDSMITAAAPNYGIAWARIPMRAQPDDLTLHLVDDAPINGQIVNLEGKPVPNASLRVMQINAAPDENLGPWLESMKSNQGDRLDLEQKHLSRFTIAPVTQVTTDAQGQFRLSGVGRDRLVMAFLDGPTIASEHLHIVTRRQATISIRRVTNHADEPADITTYYGADFKHAAAPTRPIVGVVRDKHTRQPIKGISIESDMFANNRYSGMDLIHVATDANGRFRLSGMPKGLGNKIVVVPGADHPYLITRNEIPDTPGLDPVTVEIELKRGIWIEGTLTDKATGQPVKGSLEYLPMGSNPNLANFEGYGGSQFQFIPTQADGTYRVPAMPGPGLLAVWHQDRYLRADKRDDEFGNKQESLRTWRHVFSSNYSALARIDPPKGADSIKQDITLQPGHKFAGKVLAPDGQPIAGAEIYRTPSTSAVGQPFVAHAVNRTSKDGDFEFFTDSPGEFAIDRVRSHWDYIVVAAVAPGHGVGWTEIRADSTTDNLTLQLARDDIPIKGRIVDLDGRPVSGATLQVLNIFATANEDLGPFLEAAKNKNNTTKTLLSQHFPRVSMVYKPSVTTDAQGQFSLSGIGANRLVEARLDGPTIVSEYLDILTHPGDPVVVPTYQKMAHGANTTYYGSTFRHAAAPSKPIIGVVRDKDTKQPIAGAMIRSYKLASSPISGQTIVQATTGSQGRYRLTGMPKGEGNQIQVIPGNDSPYLIYRTTVQNTPGLDPVTTDVELKRAVWIEGKLTDKVTGKPVSGLVSYFIQPHNSNVKDYVGLGNAFSEAQTDQDGSYRLAGMLGPGFIAVRQASGYLHAQERDDEFAFRDRFIATAEPSLTINYSAIAEIDALSTAKTIHCDINLDPSTSFTGTVLGPDGMPLPGAWGIGLDTRHVAWSRRQVLKTPEFKVEGFNPNQPRDLLFQHPHRGLVGVVRPRGQPGETVTVSLHPGATVIGRLIESDNRPRAGVELTLYRRPQNLLTSDDYDYFPPTAITTDSNGQFRVECLLPGGQFVLHHPTGSIKIGSRLRSGETLDMGDVTMGR